MSLTDQINQDIKAAMKAKDQAALRGLRAIKSALLLASSEKGAGDTLGEEKELQILQKLLKQRKDSIAIYQEQNRSDLLQTEQEEAETIQRYLPQPMSEAEVKAVLENIIAETGASGPGDVGKVMPVAMKALAGKADGKTISSLARELLG